MTGPPGQRFSLPGSLGEETDRQDQKGRCLQETVDGGQAIAGKENVAEIMIDKGMATVVF